MKKFMGTPYPWRWFTSNSHNRLSSEVTGKDGDVIHAYRASDGVVCVNVSQRDMPVIAAAPELLEALQELLVDVKIAQGNMRDAAKINNRWVGSSEAIQPRVDVAEAAIAKALGENS